MSNFTSINDQESLIINEQILFYLLRKYIFLKILKNYLLLNLLPRSSACKRIFFLTTEGPFHVPLLDTSPVF